MNQIIPGTRWYCLFVGYYSPLAEDEIRKLANACARFVNRAIVGDKRIFFEVDLSRSSINLGSLQFKIQSFAETWDLPHQLWQWGVGKTLAESWVQTRWKTLIPDLLPIEALDDYLYPLSSLVVASKDVGLGSSTFNLLRCLRYQNLSDLKTMPHDLLLVRLAHVLNHPLVQAEVSDPQGLMQDNWLAALTEQSLQPETDDAEAYALAIAA